MLKFGKPWHRSGPVSNPQLNFAWDANAGGDNVTGYNLYYGSASGVYDGASSPISLGVVTSYSLAMPLTLTYYALTAVNAIGESAFSAETSAP